jgi:DNA polymerase
VAFATAIAGAAGDLAGLRAALTAFQGCEAKRGARTTVFASGDPDCGLMVVGDAPDRDEDRAGVPFAGATASLVDAMFAAIGRRRDGTGDAGLYLTRAFPWRLPPSGEVGDADVALLRPFVARHVALARPRVIAAMGDVACRTLLGHGLEGQRGAWTQAFGVPVLPMTAPETLLRDPAGKRAAWADLLALSARLRDGPAT